MVLGKISDAERDELHVFMERKGALEDLFLVLGKQSEFGIDISSTHIYEKIVSDMQEVRKEINRWWSRASDAYSWRFGPGNSWNVDFYSNEVHLM